jgi:hypothetical protein
MGFSCKGKNILTPTIPNYNDRDLGLSNIYNVNSDVNFCMEDFSSPLYYMSGATKPYYSVFSGCTTGGTDNICGSIHNVSESDNFNLIFNITGGTDYSGYTGQFCYKIFSRPDFNVTYSATTSGITTIEVVSNNNFITSQTPLYENCVDFSGISSNTVTQTILNGIDLPIADNDYRLMDYVTFTPNSCSDIEIDTWSISDNYVDFNYSKDWYFVTVTNPPKPELFSTSQRRTNGVLYAETIQSNSGTDYALTYVPAGQVVNVHINGILLTKNEDYVLDYSQYPSGPVIVSFNEILEDIDVFNVVYVISETNTNLTSSSSPEGFGIETIIYSGATTGVTASTINIVNYNTTSGLYEIFLTDNILVDSSVVLSINGIDLTENLEFYKSTTTQNKLNLHPNVNLVVGDIITAFYFKELNNTQSGDLGKLSSNNVNINWNINSEIQSSQFTGSSAYFITEITEENDISYSGVTYTAITPYSGLTIYNKIFDGVEVNKKYIYRVCLNKKYVTITGDEIYTTSCSDNGSFDLTGGQALYGSP